MTTNLTGLWLGAYTYPDMIEAIPFTASIQDNGDVIVGETTEAGLPWDPYDSAHAIIDGRKTGTEVAFTKVYDTIEDSAVRYEGTISDDGEEIHGSWTIIGESSGPFTMRRATNASQASEREEQAVD